jgi:hypothetical protein
MFDTRELKRGLQDILARRFRNDGARRTIKEFSDRLNFACPYCGDSTTNRYKKRGNVYLNDMSFHCFNCGAHESLWKFFSYFGEPMPDGVADIIASAREKRAGKRRDGRRNDVVDNDTFRKLDSLAISRELFADTLHLVEITEDAGSISDYIRGRRIPEDRYANFLYSKRMNELYVLNLANNGRDIVGVQVRSFRENVPKYRSYALERCYNMCMLHLPDIDGAEKEDINRLSLIYNTLNFDIYASEIYVFEGGIDSFFLPNSLGQCGVKKDVLWLDSLSNVVYFFDNDQPGRERSAEKLKGGHKVFLWGKFLSENNFKCRVKDLNDFVCFCEDNSIDWSGIEFGGYVGDSELDIIYL